jgi:hypothetical protein
MQELVGRITALDPVASESLRVISYFDALVEAHAPAEALLRGASVLCGCASGFVAGDTAMRVDASGARTVEPVVPTADRWPSHVVGEDWRAWIEREGAPHANDEMVLERLSIGLGICLERTHPIAIARRNLEILVDSAEPVESRTVAADRLRLGSELVRIAAAPAQEPMDASARGAILPTRVGRVRAILVTGDRAGLPRHLGIGIPTLPTDLPRSWQTALLALRMSGPAEPVVDAGELGSVLLLAEAADANATPQPDVIAIEQLVRVDARSLEQLDLIARAESIRAAAIASGVHHSTMQARVIDYGDRLGFDLRSSHGRVRLDLALRLYRLATTRFS